MMRILVLGAGLQGTACAFDLLQGADRSPGNNAGGEGLSTIGAASTDVHVRLADVSVGTVPPFLAPWVGRGLTPIALDVRNVAAVRAAFAESDVVLSAIPYYFNFPLAQIAVDCGVHFADLGGNTAIVGQQRTLHDAAVAAGVAIVPDTGLAPGMVNVLAQHGINQFETVEAVRLYVGGLPQEPQPPLNYQIAYSIEGMLDYYTTPSLVLRDGVITEVSALSEVETIPFEAPVGPLEAFHTAGGLSSMGYRYAGRIPCMEYKTLRFPGHARIMDAIRGLGLLGTTPVDVSGQAVVPRDVFVRVAGATLRTGRPDFVALRVVVTGTAGGARRTRAWEVVDRYDATHGISAMMRTTGYTLSITGQLMAEGAIAAGVHTPDECFPAARYVAMLAARGIQVREVDAAHHPIHTES